MTWLTCVLVSSIALPLFGGLTRFCDNSIDNILTQNSLEGLELTVSNGILSGIRSDKDVDGKFLQTTAPITHGSSGGPLFNMMGEVIGITTLGNEGAGNLNFAIPINEAKKLLLNRSSKIQDLPNETEEAEAESEAKAIAKAKTEFEAEAAEAAAEANAKAAETDAKEKADAKGAYFVRAGKNEIYTIECKGHQLTAHCRETLSWDDRDLHKLGTPSDQRCVYMSNRVGKHIEMYRQGNELRYRFAGVADILDITDDVLAGTTRHSRPAPRTSPEIQKTLQWIQNTLKENEGTTMVLLTDNEIEGRRALMPEFNGCQVTFAYQTERDQIVRFHVRYQVDLHKLDPTTLTSFEEWHDLMGPVNWVSVETTNKEASIVMFASDWSWDPAEASTITEIIWVFPSAYAERFVKALHSAIALCGGKPSKF
jgi:hypothetical protein